MPYQSFGLSVRFHPKHPEDTKLLTTDEAFQMVQDYWGNQPPEDLEWFRPEHVLELGETRYALFLQRADHWWVGALLSRGPDPTRMQLQAGPDGKPRVVVVQSTMDEAADSSQQTPAEQAEGNQGYGASMESEPAAVSTQTEAAEQGVGDSTEIEGGLEEGWTSFVASFFLIHRVTGCGINLLTPGSPARVAFRKTLNSFLYKSLQKWKNDDRVDGTGRGAVPRGQKGREERRRVGKFDVADLASRDFMERLATGEISLQSLRANMSVATLLKNAGEGGDVMSVVNLKKQTIDLTLGPENSPDTQARVVRYLLGLLTRADDFLQLSARGSDSARGGYATEKARLQLKTVEEDEVDLDWFTTGSAVVQHRFAWDMERFVEVVGGLDLGNLIETGPIKEILHIAKTSPDFSQNIFLDLEMDAETST